MLDIIIVLAGFYLFCGIVRVLLGGFGKSDYQRDRETAESHAASHGKDNIVIA